MIPLMLVLHVLLLLMPLMVVLLLGGLQCCSGQPNIQLITNLATDERGFKGLM